MKIVKLCFRNLNSLQGDFHLDFDSGPLGGAGLFAITGPTGAGKSTILDAICVALYGQTPRLGPGSEEMMTRHTADCHAEVTFRVRSGLYRSSWALRRARNRPEGKLQPPRMELVEVGAAGEEIIEEQKRRVVARIEELTGLDFSRFTRSILLAQGGFAAFLNAGGGERAELLEKMTGTEIYSRISEAVFARFRQEEERIAQARRQLGNRNLLDGEGLGKVAAEEALRAAAVEREQGQGVLIERELAWHAKAGELQELIARARREEEELGEEVVRRQPELARLEAAEKALPLQASFAVLGQLGSQRAALANKCAELTAELPVLQAEQERLGERSAREQAEFGQFLGEAEAKELLLRVVEKIDTRLRDAAGVCALRREKLGELRGVLSRQAQELAALREKIAGLELLRERYRREEEERAGELNLAAAFPLIEARLAARSQVAARQAHKHGELASGQQRLAALGEKERVLRKELAGLKETLARESAALGQVQTAYQLLAREQGLREREAEQEALELRLRDWRGLTEIGRQAEETGAKRGQEFAAGQTAAGELAAAVARGQALAGELEAGEGILQQLEEKRTLERLVAKHAEARRQLAPGQPCPLCGSPDHPWASGLPQPEAGEAALGHQKSRLGELRRALEEARERFGALQTAAALHRQRLESLEREGELLGQRWQLLAAQCAWPGRIAEWRELEPLQAEAAGKIAAGRQRLAEMKGLSESLGRLQLTLRELERQESEAALARQKIKGEEEGAADRQGYIAQELTALDEQAGEINAQLLPLLSPYREPLPEAGGEGELLARLRRRVEEMEARRSGQLRVEAALVELGRELAGGVSQEAGSAARLAEEEQLLAAATGEWRRLGAEREQLLDERPVAKERQGLQAARQAWEERLQGSAAAAATLAAAIKNKAELLAATQSEAAARAGEEERAGKDFAAGLRAAGFASIPLFQQALVADGERQGLIQLRRGLREREATLRARLAEAEPKLRALLAEPAAGTAAEAEARLAAQRARLAAGIEELGAVREVLRQQRELRRAEEQLLLALAGQEREYQRWQKLNELIGSADGKKFRRFAQGLTLDYLIGLANLHLAKLNDRYLLQRHEREELGLEVVDGYQANITRPASTLSGGESFLASLALALGLSGLASRKTTIDSLFLDEGFGSLDGETLEYALAALDGLNSSGKTIGIISHVEALKERIPVQIRIHKRAGGVSDLEVVG